nr:hypothetical protein BdHM001_35020 [Bdellovibrio sp. HM001]
MNTISRTPSDYPVDETAIYEASSLYQPLPRQDGEWFITHRDGGISRIIEITGINDTAFDEGDYTSVNNSISSAIEAIANTDVTVQFVCLRDKMKIEASADGLPKYLAVRIENVKKRAESDTLFVNRYFISVYAPGVKSSFKETVRSYINLFRGKAEQQDIETFRKKSGDILERSKEVYEISEGISITLGRIGFGTRKMTSADDCYDVMRLFYRPNASKFEKRPVISPADGDVRQQLMVGPRAEQTHQDFILDDYYHKVYTLDRPPKNVLFGDTVKTFTNIPYEYIYCVCFRVMTHEEAVKVFRRKLRDRKIMNEAHNKGTGTPDKTVEKEVEKVDGAFEQFAVDGGKAVECSVNFCLRVPLERVARELRQRGISFDEWKRVIDVSLKREHLDKFGGSSWGSEPYTQWFVFNKMVPGMAEMRTNVLKPSVLLAGNIPYFWNLGIPMNNIEHNGVNHFFDDQGGIIPFDIMDRTLSAWNWNITGDTGSGKSVIVQTIMAMQYAGLRNKKPPVIRIMDVGGDRGSYAKLIKLSGGELINLSRPKKPSIPLFDLNANTSLPKPKKVQELSKFLREKGVPGDDDLMSQKIVQFYLNILNDGLNNLTERQYADLFESTMDHKYNPEWRDILTLKAGEVQPTDSAVSMLMAIILAMASNDVTTMDAAQTFEVAQIRDLILSVYNMVDGRYPTMTDLCNTLKKLGESSGGDNDANVLYLKLKAWTRTGPFPMFDLPLDVNLNNDTIVVDFKGVDSNPTLRYIYLLLFNNLFSNHMYFVQGRVKMIIRDECHKFLADPFSQKFVEEDMRTARKSGFATLTISQFVTDFEHMPGILGNTQAFVIGRIPDKEIFERIASRLRFPPKIRALYEHPDNVGNIKDRDGNTLFSRFLVKMGQRYFVLNNILHPVEYFVFSSSESDNLMIDYYTKITRQMSLEDAIYHIADGKHIGDTGLADYMDDCGQKVIADKIRKVRAA